MSPLNLTEESISLLFLSTLIFITEYLRRLENAYSTKLFLIGNFYFRRVTKTGSYCDFIFLTRVYAIGS